MKNERITIEKIINGGYGLGRVTSGQVVLVRNVLPGEVVIVTTWETKKNFLFGKQFHLEKPHKDRITPPCPYYRECGGCDLQHCSYPTQLEIKESILLDLLQRQKLQLPVYQRDPLPILPSPSQFNYRQRIRLKVDESKRLGFAKYQSNSVVPIKKCLLAEKSINNCLEVLQNDPASTQLLEISNEVEIQQNPDTYNCICIFNLKRKYRPKDIQDAKTLSCSSGSIERIFFRGDDFAIAGPYCQENVEHFGNKLQVVYPPGLIDNHQVTLTWEAGGFIQVNLEQNRQLIKKVIEFCSPQQTDTCLDLFCGMGNFTIPLANKVSSVLGVEGQGSAIRSARFNSSLAGLDNTEFLKKSVHLASEQFTSNNKQFDIVVVDPPRAGIPGLAPILAKLSRSKLIYISCDPATLCRDLTNLISCGFHLSRIQPVDMFPQTHHLETVVLLEK